MMVLRPMAAGLLSLALGVALTACGGSGSSSRGGGALTEQDKAAAAGLLALGVADTGLGMVADAHDELQSGGEEVTPRMATFANGGQESFCTTGTQVITEGIEDGPAELASPYHGGKFEQMRIQADACNVVVSAEGFSFSSYTDGVFEFGSADAERVTYFRAADANDDIAGFYQMRTTGLLDLNMKMRGVAHVCDGCASPEHGMDFEMISFLRVEQVTGGRKMTMLQGESLDTPFQMRSKGALGGTGQREIEGRLGFTMQGNPCNFDAVYETLSPLMVENNMTDDEAIIGGELRIKIVGGETYHMEFLGKDTVMLNGAVLTEADLQRLHRQCAFDDEGE